MARELYRYGNRLLSPPREQVGERSDPCIELEIDERGVVLTNQSGRDVVVKYGPRLAEQIRLQEAG